MANRFQVGSVIEIHGLRARDDLNGQPAIVVGYVEESGRFQCELTSASKMVLLKPDNIIEGAVTSCHSALALSLVRLARESSQWKLKSLLNGKKLCEGCDCHLNDAKLAPCVCIAGLGASTLSGLNLPADLLASLPAELQASMNLGGASPSVGTRTICFDGGVSAPVQLPESAMVDEDVMQPRHKMRGATTQHVWLPTESRVPFYIRRAGRVCAASAHPGAHAGFEHRRRLGGRHVPLFSPYPPTGTARREHQALSLCLITAGEAAPYLWREKIHAVLRFRVHGHTVAPKDFAGESWMRHFANEQAPYRQLKWGLNDSPHY